MQNHSATLREMFVCLWSSRALIKASAQREVLGRYRGSTLGLLWSLFNPVFMLGVYTFVFSEIFKTRWNAQSDSKAEFALVLFAGLMVFNIFVECVNRAPSLIVSNPNYVKKVVFPLEILPLVNLLSALYHAFISLLVWLAAYFVFIGVPHSSTLYLPLVVFPYCFFIMGLSWVLASLGVYLRDVGQFIGVVTSVLLFISPIFYPVTAIPVNYQPLLFLNPLTPVIELSRDVLYWGKAPNLEVLSTYWIASVMVAWAGFAWFQRTRKGFADVI
jgi:lipopolysaccharide transport system permease protein